MMQKWEYRTESSRWKAGYELNDIGNEGWELVSHVIDREGWNSKHYYTFKRPKNG